LNGIGSAAKRALRAAYYTWDESMVRRKAPDEFLTWHALESGCLDPNYFMHVVPERKLIYTEVPKTGSSFILSELATAFGRRRAAGNMHRRAHSGLSCPRDMGIGPFVQLVENPETFIFSSVRNPLTRLVSCYLDKFAAVLIGDNSYISNTYIAYRRVAGKFVIDGRPLSFAEFVEFACETAPLKYDGHWSRQADIVSNWIAKPHVLVRFETLSRDFAQVLTRFGADPAQVERVLASAVTTTDHKARDLLTERTRARIVEAYATDFARFDYPIHL